MDVFKIAKVCHEVNRAYCQATYDDQVAKLPAGNEPTEEMKAMLQPPWEETPQEIKDYAYNGVAFHIRYPNAKPSESHENWMREKKENGWKYGLVKSIEKKEHPCFMPYNDLPLEQKAKYYLFKTIVDVMIKL